MSDPSIEAVELTFPDGSTEGWQVAKGNSMSAACLSEFMRICGKPTSVNVRITETATPELPFEDTTPTDAQEQSAG